MNNPISTLEISNTNVKLVVGYVLENAPIVLYASNVDVAPFSTESELIEDELIIKAIKTLIKDANERLQLQINRVCLSIPSKDLEILDVKNRKETIGSEISRNDILNVYKLLRQTSIGSDKTIVNVVPQSYFISSGEKYPYPPIKTASTYIGIQAYIHIIPTITYNRYLQIVEASGLGVIKTFIDQYGLTKLFESASEETNTYLLVDFKANTTLVSFVGYNQLFQTLTINYGSNTLTKVISEQMSIEMNKADELKRIYGLDFIKRKVQLPLLINNENNEVTNNDLNTVIISFLDRWLKSLKDSFQVIASKQQKQGIASEFPVIITGGGSKLKGLISYLENRAPEIKFMWPSLRIIGARDHKFAICLGLIKAYNLYNQQIGDERSSIGPLTKE